MLVAILLALGGLIWLGIAQPGVARAVRWALLGTGALSWVLRAAH